jgi:hypothetical protein
VGVEFGDVRARTQVPDEDMAVFRTADDKVVEAVQGADSAVMQSMSACLFLFLHIDNPKFPSFLANNQPFTPLNTADQAFNNFLCIAFLAIPDISSIIEYNSHIILRTPIEQIGVEIILKFGGIEDPVRLFRDVTGVWGWGVQGFEVKAKEVTWSFDLGEIVED